MKIVMILFNFLHKLSSSLNELLTAALPRSRQEELQKNNSNLLRAAKTSFLRIGLKKAHACHEPGQLS